MTSNQARELAAAMDDEAVSVYLQQNSDFFERRPQLLSRLRLRHPRDGATISLIERQVEVLREKYQAQEQKLAEFVQVARANNVLADKLHRFTCRLLGASGRAGRLAEMEASLREDFDLFHSVLVLPAAALPPPDASPPRFLKALPEDETLLRSFDALFATCRPRCGQVRDTQREFLFGSEAANIGSVALVPLAGEAPQGLLALGSADHDRFHPGMSTEFLSRLGELISETLVRE